MKNILSALFLVDRGWFKDFSPSFNGPIWYIDVLLLCYIFYFIFKLFQKRTNIDLKYLAILFVCIVAILNYTKISLPFMWSCNKRGYMSFFMGVIIFQIAKKLTKTSGIIVSILGGVAYLLMFIVLGEFNYYGLIIILYPSILLLCISIKQIQLKTLLILGAMQFEAYLINVPMYAIGVVLCLLLNLSILHNYFTMIAFTVFIEFVAYLMYKFVEKPLTKNLQRIIHC